MGGLHLAAMDQARALLDSLMGEERDGEVKTPKYKYYDPEVCQCFLEGICLQKVFNNTKLDNGPCHLAHDVKLRSEYLKKKADGRDNFEPNVRNELKRSIDECDRKIQRSVKRLEDEGATCDVMLSVASLVASNPQVDEIVGQIREKSKEILSTYLVEKDGDKEKREAAEEAIETFRAQRAAVEATCLIEKGFGETMPKSQEVIELETQITAKLSEAEALGEQGEVDAMNQAMAEVEQLKVAKTQAANNPIKAPMPPAQENERGQKARELRVCDICGSFISIRDNDQRLQDHFAGKLHIGYTIIRDRLHEIDESIRTQRSAGSRSAPASGDRGRDRRDDGDRGRDRRDSRDDRRDDRRDSYRDDRRDSGRDRRDSRRDRDHDRRRDRSRERSPYRR